MNNSAITSETIDAGGLAVSAIQLSLDATRCWTSDVRRNLRGGER